MTERSHALAEWARREAGVTAGDWQMVSGDASFRRYFRLQNNARSWLAVDAPPERENARHFVALAQALRERGLPTPAIYASDFERGFLLIEDFGDTLLLSRLQGQTGAQQANRLYGDAMNLLADWQAITALPVSLTAYEPSRLQMELELFPTWLLAQHLRRPFSAAEAAQYQQVMHLLLANAAAQPQVLCHRDFHSRNLMLRTGLTTPAIIDFQDAVWGPVTYDLVSLLRDCYIEWPANQVRDWALHYRDRHVATGAAFVDDATWLRWFDWMGLQRHLKVLGIFARLNYRDGKRAYLRDLPLTLRYCVSVAEQYEELRAFGRWLRDEVGNRLDGNGEVR